MNIENLLKEAINNKQKRILELKKNKLVNEYITLCREVEEYSEELFEIKGIQKVKNR